MLNITIINNEAIDLSGYRPESMVQIKVLEYIPEELIDNSYYQKIIFIDLSSNLIRSLPNNIHKLKNLDFYRKRL